MKTDTRLHHLDWLRVLAFGLLIFYHTGMLYVTWPYHVKSPRIVPGVEWPMVLTNPWRLALLFFISGVASRFLLGKLGPGRFARDRVGRLLPALLLGMLVVVPPQTWYELTTRGRFTGGYLSFWLGHYLAADRTLGVIVPTWNHLWFLVYLLFYCLVFAALAAAWRGRRAIECPTGLLLLAPGAWLAAANVLAIEWRPDTHAFADDWAGHLRWIGLFAAGLVAARADGFWRRVRERRRALVSIALSLAAAFVAVRAALGAGWVGDRWDGPVYAVASAAFGWATILAILGLASEHLNRPSWALSYLNVAILPVYMLHQTVLIALAVALFPRRLPLAFESTLVVAGTFGACLLLYELAIRRFALLRFCFGLKRRDAPAAHARREPGLAPAG
jgi:surface polysaccharide O-acyltransferase-like enzyme